MNFNNEYLSEISYELLEKEFLASPQTYFVEQLAIKAHELNPDGLFLEFGVFKGGTINRIARHLPEKTIHGFDTFKGLPTTWLFNPMISIGRDAFDIGGQPPETESNVILYKGLFSDTLPKMLEDNPGPISFLHIDSDLYQSCVDIFELCENKILDNSIIAFDEIGCGYGNYDYWKDGEAKAFIEMMNRTGYKWRMLCRSAGDTNPGAVQIKTK